MSSIETKNIDVKDIKYQNILPKILRVLTQYDGALMW